LLRLLSTPDNQAEGAREGRRAGQNCSHAATCRDLPSSAMDFPSSSAPPRNLWRAGLT